MNSGIESIFDSYKVTAEAKDLEAYLAICSDDIFIFDAWDEWSLRGKVPCVKWSSAEKAKLQKGL